MAPHAESNNGSSNGAVDAAGIPAASVAPTFKVNSPNVTYTDAEIRSKYTYRTTSVETDASGNFVATPEGDSL